MKKEFARMPAREWCRTLSAEAQKVLADHFGDRASVERSNARYTDNDFTLKFTFGRPAADGNIVSAAAQNFERYAKMRGFEPTDLGATFSARGRHFTITGWNNRARVMPVQAERDDGKRFKFAAKTVLHALGRELESITKGGVR
ncbi:MAG: hypothetical protein MIO87_01265 [Methanomassiliicoccales archaeon]|nr:hypothetical protein [Methanomassiliicoccales archaeon]